MCLFSKYSWFGQIHYASDVISKIDYANVSCNSNRNHLSIGFTKSKSGLWYVKYSIRVLANLNIQMQGEDHLCGSWYLNCLMIFTG